MSFLTSRGWHRSLAALPLFLIGSIADAGCHDTGAGTPPPLDELYFPVGLQVSHGGSVLYAVNSNFDIRYNGGTLQSYDLRLIRRHALLAIADPSNPTLPLLRQSSPAGCPSSETCARQADSKVYYRDAAVIGAMATDLVLSLPPSELQGDFVRPNAPPQATKVHADDAPVAAGTSTTDRLFLSVRGNSTLTWATVERDNLQSAPNPNDTEATYAPFRIRCGQDPVSNRCDVAHQIGADSNERDTGHIRMPGSPEGLAISEDGQSLVVTHQSDTKTTLFSTGLSRTSGDDAAPPSIQHVADEVPFGGIGIASVPHDPDAFLGAREMPRPAFLQTSRAVAELSLIRRYSDEDDGAGSGNSDRIRSGKSCRSPVKPPTLPKGPSEA